MSCQDVLVQYARSEKIVGTATVFLHFIIAFRVPFVNSSLVPSKPVDRIGHHGAGFVNPANPEIFKGKTLCEAI
jgi:hypothetical protein